MKKKKQKASVDGGGGKQIRTGSKKVCRTPTGPRTRGELHKGMKKPGNPVQRGAKELDRTKQSKNDNKKQEGGSKKKKKMGDKRNQRGEQMVPT